MGFCHSQVNKLKITPDNLIDNCYAKTCVNQNDKCFICGQLGHFANECEELYRIAQLQGNIID